MAVLGVAEQERQIQDPGNLDSPAISPFIEMTFVRRSLTPWKDWGSSMESLVCFDDAWLPCKLAAGFWAPRLKDVVCHSLSDHKHTKSALDGCPHSLERAVARVTPDSTLSSGTDRASNC